MTAGNWEDLSAWFNAWLAADAAARERLRTRLAAERPDLLAEADALTAMSGHLAGFLETPALMLAARELADEDPPLPVDSLIGPYQLTGLLARGGMGDVYRATDVRLGRDVAIKVLARSRTGDPRRVERFMHEARMTASLDHPNVVRIYDVGRFRDYAYLVAELLEGETLRARIARGPMPVDHVMRIALEVTPGLAAAHAAGLVHRDLKPDNIFLTESGTTKILDFGIAKLAQDDTDRDRFATLTGVVLGTAGYLAPEQIRGEAIDARADLFALGAVLFEMLAGTRAFAREHLVETLHAILHDDPSPALATREDVPPALMDVVLRLLEKAPDARFQSSADLIGALEAVEMRRPAPAAAVAQTRLSSWGTASDPAARKTASTRTTTRSAMQAARAGPRATVVGVAILAAVVVATIAVARYWSSPAELTLAVIPFRSVPSSADNILLELGLADAMVSRLGQLLELRVLSLSATEGLVGQDPRAIARSLPATHVLTGTLQRDDFSVRATVQLFSAADERTIPVGPVPADASSMFTLQDIIVEELIKELAPWLEAGARRRLAQPGTGNNNAYEAYLRGRAYLTKPGRAELTRAAGLFRQAISWDPDYADAWASLASAYKRMPIAGDAAPAQAFDETRRAATHALGLDASHAEAMSALGTVAFWYEWDYSRAEHLLRGSLAIQPSAADAQVLLAHLLSNLGQHDQALLEIRRARTFDPAWPVARALEGQFLFMARRYDHALAHLNEMIKVTPSSFQAHVMRVYPLLALQRYDEALDGCDQVALLDSSRAFPRPYSWSTALCAYALARLGRHEDAHVVLAQLRSLASEQYVPPHHEALVLHALGQDNEALTRLREAVDGRDVFVTFLGVDPKWDGLRDSPEFRDLLSQVNLLEVSDRVRR